METVEATWLEVKESYVSGNVPLFTEWQQVSAAYPSIPDRFAIPLGQVPPGTVVTGLNSMGEFTVAHRGMPGEQCVHVPPGHVLIVVGGYILSLLPKDELVLVMDLLSQSQW